MSAACTDILMYHSISDAPGATSISPQVFAAQMAAIATAGVPVISMDQVLERHISGAATDYALAITFDDGFGDFADTAWPVMRGHGFAPLVYLASGHVGGRESWPGCNVAARQLMDWGTIRDLAGAGVDFGSHSVSHPDLRALDDGELQAELLESKTRIEAEINRPARHFAVPYGYTNSRVIRRIADHYATSVGTTLGSVKAGCDIHDLPRLEMHYFTDPARWQSHLAGTGGAYLAARKILRRVRQSLRPPLGGAAR